jgi:cell division protein ZapA
MGRVQVEIYGQSYSLKDTDDPQHIRELAALVDAKMKEIGQGTGTTDPLRVAILAALTIADDLAHLRAKHAEVETAFENTADRLLTLTEPGRVPSRS